MQRSTLIEAIYKAIHPHLLNVGQVDAFNEQARLNEELYLDSVLIMQMLLSLELELGIDIPDTAFGKDDFATVASLTDFLMGQCEGSQEDLPEITAQATDEVQQEFEDIKVHCFVSCLCEIIKSDERVDHRPFYFGVWDADVVIDENYHIAYHSPTINHDFFRQWYEKLYGVAVKPWYRHDISKAQNITTLLHMLDNKTNSQRIMVMLDMFRLPERENKFNQNPFPHYVMLEKTDTPEIWFMHDPDFRWEGTQQKSQVLHAIESDAVAGGYYFDSHQIQASQDEVIRDYYRACIKPGHNPMTDCIRKIIHAHTSNNHETELSPSGLNNALDELPVLAIRKYAYEHGLAFFWRALDLDDDEFESWCDVIEALVSTYKQIQYRAMKIAKNHSLGITDNNLLKEINTLLDQQNARELQIKQRLQEVFEQWCESHGWQSEHHALDREAC